MKKAKIAIIDYGVGNLKSIKKAVEHFDAKAKITNEEKDIEESDAIVLPGVGAFPDAMAELRQKKYILNAVKEKPALGICLGMQLFFTESEEVKLTKGLNLIQGRVIRLPDNVKVPQMGWNTIKIKTKKSRLLKNIKDNEYFYFVHSYYCAANKSEKAITATCEYGIEFPAIIEKDNLFGVQFHPEKSGNEGLKMLRNFLSCI